MFPFAFLERCLCRPRGASVLGLLFALLPRSVAAQSPPIELTWHAPPECPQRDAVLSRARSLLGAKTLKVGSVRADGTIEKADDGFELTLLIDEGGQGGERKVWARQCDELSGAAAIALVLLLTSTNTATDSAVPSADDRHPDPPRLPPKLPPPPPPIRDDGSNPRRASRSWHLLAAAPQMAVGIGPLPKPSLGLGVGVGFQAQAWSVRLLGQWFSTQAVAAPVEPYGADVKRAAAGLWGCWDLHHADWSLSPCLQASVAHLRASGYGPFLLPQTQRQMSFAVGGGAIGRLQPLSWLALVVGVGAQVELTRPLILLGTVGPVRQLAPVSATLQLGPEWIF